MVLRDVATNKMANKGKQATNGSKQATKKATPKKKRPQGTSADPSQRPTVVCQEFNNGASPLDDGSIFKMLKRWDKKDREESPSYDVSTIQLVLAGKSHLCAEHVAKDMPILWCALWSMPAANQLKKLQTWAMLLISMVMCARPSEVTTERRTGTVYCPLIEDYE